MNDYFESELSLDDAETLLENKKYVECSSCCKNTNPNARCSNCYGWGFIVNARYAEAARRAGVSSPKVLSTNVRIILSAIRKYGIHLDLEKVRELMLK